MYSQAQEAGKTDLGVYLKVDYFFESYISSRSITDLMFQSYLHYR